MDVAHSLIFTYGLRPATPLKLSIVDWTPPVPTHTIEGMWWKQEPNVTGFVALANLAAEPAQVSVQVTDSASKPIGQHDVTVSPHGMKMVDLSELEMAGASGGGIHIVSSGSTDQLIANGGLEDLSTGYSAVMPLDAIEVQKDAASEMSLASLGLMAGPADPMMLFPNGTTFTPYSVLRNIGDAPLSIAPTVWYMQGGAARSVELPKIDLLPSETRMLDVISLLSAAGLKNFSGSFNLVFGTTAKPGALLIASGSVDQTNTYVFEVMPHFIAEGGGKSMQYWSIGNGDDTMVTVWNPADEAQDFVVSLFYTGGKYAVPLHLEARATRMFNISEIVHSQIPDAAGNVVPADVQQGGFKIAGSLADNQPVLVGIDAGVYNVRKATCGSVCEQCNGYTTLVTIDGLFTVPVNGSHQENAYANWNTGGQYNVTGNASWSSDHTNIATVSNSGGNKGLASGVSPGGFKANWILVNAPVGTGYLCHSANTGCPVSNFASNASGTTKLTITSISPNWGQAGTAVGVTVSGAGFGTGPTLNFSGTGITVGYVSRNDTRIQATLTIASNAPIGIQDVTVTNTATVDGGPQTSDSLSFQVTPTHGVPVNFHMTAARDQGGGALPLLEADFVWQSSTGNVADMDGCFIKEHVTFPNTNNGTCPSGSSNCFYPSSPPWPARGSPGSGIPNPTDTGNPGTNALLEANPDFDTFTNLNFVKPYSANAFSGTQLFQYQCNGSSWTTLYGPVSINYSFAKNASGKWAVTISRGDTTKTSTYVLANQ